MKTTLNEIKALSDKVCASNEDPNTYGDAYPILLEFLGKKEQDDEDLYISDVLDELGIVVASFAFLPIYDKRLHKLAIFSATQVQHLIEDHEDGLLINSFQNAIKILNKTATEKEISEHQSWALPNSEYQSKIFANCAFTHASIVGGFGYDARGAIVHAYRATYYNEIEQGKSEEQAKEIANNLLLVIENKFKEILKG